MIIYDKQADDKKKMEASRHIQIVTPQVKLVRSRETLCKSRVDLQDNARYTPSERAINRTTTNTLVHT